MSGSGALNRARSGHSTPMSESGGPVSPQGVVATVELGTVCEVVVMMYGYGAGWWILMPLVWLTLLGVLVWVVVRLVQSSAGAAERPGPPDQPTLHRDTAMEILDRRFAAGEIDAETYRRDREQLAGRS
jgi:putative membrane protein